MRNIERTKIIKVVLSSFAVLLLTASAVSAQQTQARTKTIKGVEPAGTAALTPNQAPATRTPTGFCSQQSLQPFCGIWPGSYTVNMPAYMTALSGAANDLFSKTQGSPIFLCCEQQIRNLCGANWFHGDSASMWAFWVGIMNKADQAIGHSRCQIN